MKLWQVFFASLVIGASVGSDLTPDGVPSQSTLPQDQRLHNTGGMGPGGPGSGAGLCVFTSIEMAARSQNVTQLIGFQQWMTHKPGGGYPEKVDKMIDQFCREKGLPKPLYIQVTNGDLDILEKACQSGRMVGITYNYSPTGRYNGRRIAHMVDLVNAGTWWGVLDNNYEKSIEWMTRDEFKPVFGKDGWAVILLSPSVPINPHN